MARAGMEKLKDPGGVIQSANLVEFAKTHAISAGGDVNIDMVGQSKSHDRHKIPRDKRLFSATMDKRHLPADSANLAYVLEPTPFTAGSAVPADRFLTWYLPWNPNGGHVTMHIPNEAVLNRDGQNVNPAIFFTAQVTGCSVFIRGSTKRPEVFHGGSAGKKTWDGSSAAHWRDLFNKARPGTFKQGTFAEINKTHYLGGETFGQKFNTPIINNSIAQVKLMEAARQFTMLDAMGFGCVFGVRDASNDWTFYLQENIRFAYSRSPTPAFSNMVYANRPLRLSRVFPTRAVLHTVAAVKALP